MFKTLGFGSIDVGGLKRVGVHALLLGLGYLATQGETYIVGHDWGQYSVLVMAINTIVFTFLEKLLSSYDVPLATISTSQPTTAGV